MQIKGNPMTRDHISEVAWKLRQLLGLVESPWVDVIDLIERKIPELFGDEISVQIMPVEDMGSDHGRTIPDEGKMYIREDVYLGAIDGSGRDRATIVHEIGHFIFHSNLHISFARIVGDNVRLQPFKDPEWQAKAFAGEFLVPRYLTQHMSVDEIMDKCGVSFDSATIQWRKMHKGVMLMEKDNKNTEQ